MSDPYIVRVATKLKGGKTQVDSYTVPYADDEHDAVGKVLSYCIGPVDGDKITVQVEVLYDEPEHLGQHVLSTRKFNRVYCAKGEVGAGAFVTGTVKDSMNLEVEYEKPLIVG